MERFPTEIMVQIASCLPKNDLSRFGTCSSKCATIAQPQLYHTLTLLEKSDSFRRCSQFLMNVASRRHLPSMIRVLSIVGEDAWPELSLAELIRLCDHIEELLLPGSDIGAYPSDSRLFFGMPVSHLRRFRCRRHKAIPDLMKWVTRITTLSDVRLPERSNMKMAAYLGHTIVPPAWLKNLERYWGPPEVLGGLKSDCKLLHLSTHLDMSDSQLRQLASACGDQLQTLHHFSEYGYGWARDPNLPPALLPQLFPNLRSVAWILINPIDREEMVLSGDHELLPKHDDVVLDAIRQLSSLRYVWLKSRDDSSIQPNGLTRFIADIKRCGNTPNHGLRGVYIYHPVGYSKHFTYLSRATEADEWKEMHLKEYFAPFFYETYLDA